MPEVTNGEAFEEKESRERTKTRSQERTFLALPMFHHDRYSLPPSRGYRRKASKGHSVEGGRRRGRDKIKFTQKG